VPGEDGGKVWPFAAARCAAGEFKNEGKMPR
jgi:hypothetical protein